MTSKDDAVQESEAQRDPENDPFACSLCGCYLGEAARVSGEDYCESCRHDDEQYVRCEACGDRLPEWRATGVDVSPPDEYYPEFIYFCPADAPEDDGGEEA